MWHSMWRSTFRRYSPLLLIACLCVQSQGLAKNQKKERPGSLQKSSFEEILDRYLFISDFSDKPAERPISNEVIWKYPYKLAPQGFELDLRKNHIDSMVFKIGGADRITEHFARGRVDFLAGRYDDAHTIWLAGRQKYFTDSLTNRRYEFFLALNAAHVLREKYDEYKGDYHHPELRKKINRLAYFLAAVFILRRDIPDPQIDKHAPWALYNLSVIYYRLERWSPLTGSTQEGLAMLLKQGRKEYRPKFRQLLAEVFIKAQDYLPAIQELDTAIRQDKDKAEAARMFNRAADIYFDLNNYELAEDVYMMASRIDETRSNFEPTQAVMRAEALFWLGKYKEARALLSVAVDSTVKKERDWLTISGTLPWARLRVADTWLVELEKAKSNERVKLAEQTRLAYFKVETEHPSSEAAQIARIRGACMDLPSYEGKNVKHAREYLEKLKHDKSAPMQLAELVDACLVGSYVEREQTPEMVARVREFSDKYPLSRYLDKMIPSVRTVQATNINEFFDKGFDFLANEFFEKKRKALYPSVSNELASKLFASYVNTSQVDKAKEFWKQHQLHTAKSAKSDDELLRELLFLSEVKHSRSEISYNKDLAALITKAENQEWNKTPSTKSKGYVERILNSPKSSLNLAWILNASKAWGDISAESLCSVTLPLMLRMANDSKSRKFRQLTSREVRSTLPSQWNELSGHNASCAQSWLDLEARTISLKELSARYGARSEWKLEGPWLERLWTHSEELESAKDLNAARAIWQRIATDAPTETFEARMAKTRLDPSQTEIETLWKDR